MSTALTRLITLLLLGLAIYSLVFATQKMNTTPQKKTKKIQETFVLTPTPEDEENIDLVTDKDCLVTVFGKTYNVTEYESSQSGELFFVCGTDMSRQFEGDTEVSLELLQEYEVDVSGKFLNKAQ